jgi:hypothetical protein
MVVIAVVIGVAALISGEPVNQALGGLTLVVAGLVVATTGRGPQVLARLLAAVGLSRPVSKEEPEDARYPRETAAERFLPVVFGTAVIVIITALAVAVALEIAGW